MPERETNNAESRPQTEWHVIKARVAAASAGVFVVCPEL